MAMIVIVTMTRISGSDRAPGLIYHRVLAVELDHETFASLVPQDRDCTGPKLARTGKSKACYQEAYHKEAYHKETYRLSLYFHFHFMK
jgi:hypothetical protein